MTWGKGNVTLKGTSPYKSTECVERMVSISVMMTAAELRHLGASLQYVIISCRKTPLLLGSVRVCAGEIIHSSRVKRKCGILKAGHSAVLFLKTYCQLGCLKPFESTYYLVRKYAVWDVALFYSSLTWTHWLLLLFVFRFICHFLNRLVFADCRLDHLFANTHLSQHTHTHGVSAPRSLC